jgi:hypothetical protein
VTRRKAMAIGIRLALGRGTSKGMPLLRSRQTALDAATGHDAATAVMLARLANTLSTISVAAARAPMTTTTMPAIYASGLDAASTARSVPLTTAGRRVTTRKVAVNPVTADEPTSRPTRTDDRIHDTVSPTANRAAQLGGDGPSAVHLTARQASMDRVWAPRHAGPRTGAPARDEGATQPKTADRQAMVVPMLPSITDIPSRLPTVKVTPSATLVDAQSFARIIDAPSPGIKVNDIAPLSGVTQISRASGYSAQHGHQGDPAEELATEQNIGEGTFRHISAAPIRISGSQSDAAPEKGKASNSLARSYLKVNDLPQGTRALADSGSQSAQTDQLPRQGTIVLDGMELGRWIVSYLEGQALRPGTMTTGIDPRITATFPGATTSA